MSTRDTVIFLICGAGGASNIFKPRSTGEGAGRTWYAPWSSASAYGLMINAGAKMTQMENRIVLARFKDHNLRAVFSGHWHALTERTVGDVMSHPVVTAQPAETLASVAQRMRDNKVGSVVAWMSSAPKSGGSTRC